VTSPASASACDFTTDVSAALLDFMKSPTPVRFPVLELAEAVRVERDLPVGVRLVVGSGDGGDASFARLNISKRRRLDRD